MPKKIYSVRLSTEERQQSQSYIHRGQRSARRINRARILLRADASCSDDEITTVLGVNRATVHRIRKSDDERGLDHTLQARDRSGAPCKIGGRGEAILTMVAWANPPPGYGRWTLQ
jgi:transposase